MAQYIAAYAVADAVALEELYNDDSIHGSSYEWGMDPRRPDLADLKESVKREESEQMGEIEELGPILTDMRDGDIPAYRCEVEGCKGGWWFESALKRHQEEEPHRMVRGWGVDDVGDMEE